MSITRNANKAKSENETGTQPISQLQHQAASTEIPESLGFHEGNGYTQFNNAVLDEMLSQITNLAEYKVVQYIYRHTEGFRQKQVCLSVEEIMNGCLRGDGERMDRGTGMCERSVKSGIKRGVAHGYITRCQKGNRVYYSLKMASPQEQCESRLQDSPTKTAHPRAKKTSPRLKELRSLPYAEYLLTPEWQAKKQKALRFAGFRCQLCNSASRLNVHHRTYERLGNELLSDLCTFCNDCHMLFHANQQEVTE